MKQPVGAGGTEGGIGRFFIGLIMMIAGGYLFFNNIHVGHRFGLGYGLFRIGGFSMTSGYVLIPFMFGVGMIFYNLKNYLGWILAGSSIIMLAFGVITSLHFSFRHMTAYELLTILVLFIGGIGLFLSSLRGLPAE